MKVLVQRVFCGWSFVGSSLIWRRILLVTRWDRAGKMQERKRMDLVCELCRAWSARALFARVANFCWRKCRM